MQYLIAILLILAAHFSLTPFAPAPAGKAKFYWPFSADSKPILSFGGGLPQESGSFITPLLAGVAGLCFLLAVFSLFGWWVPADWWRPLVLAACSASILLYLLYFGAGSLLPLAINVLILWGVLAQDWPMLLFQS